MSTESNAPGEEVKRPFLRLTWQKGLPNETGVNGCRVDDVLAVVAEKLEGYQAGPLACEENAEALMAIATALASMEARRTRRVEQGVLNTMEAHVAERTEDTELDFSATGA